MERCENTHHASRSRHLPAALILPHISSFVLRSNDLPRAHTRARLIKESSMFRHTPALLIVALLAGCQAGGTTDTGRATTSASSPSSDPLPGSSATLVVHGMGCPMCANNIDKQLLRIP